MFSFKKKSTFKKNFRQGAEQALGALAVGLITEVLYATGKAVGGAIANASKEDEKKQGNASANENKEQPESKGQKSKAA